MSLRKTSGVRSGGIITRFLLSVKAVTRYNLCSKRRKEHLARLKGRQALKTSKERRKNSIKPVFRSRRSIKTSRERNGKQHQARPSKSMSSKNIKKANRNTSIPSFEVDELFKTSREPSKADGKQHPARIEKICKIFHFTISRNNFTKIFKKLYILIALL